MGSAPLPRSSRGWTRTSDKTVNSRLLYQLSYAGKFLPDEGRQNYSTSGRGGVKEFAGGLGSPWAGTLPGDQDDERRRREKRAEHTSPEADILSESGVLSPRHVEPVTRLDQEVDHLRAYGEGTQIDGRTHAVADQANLARIGRSALKCEVDLRRRSDSCSSSESTVACRRGARLKSLVNVPHIWLEKPPLAASVWIHASTSQSQPR